MTVGRVFCCVFLSGARQAYGSFLVDGLDDKLLVVEGDVPDLTPREAYLGGHPGEVQGSTGVRNTWSCFGLGCVSGSPFSTCRSSRRC